MKTYTTQEIADALGMPRDTAYALATALRHAGALVEHDVRKHPSGKGRGTIVYRVDEVRLRETLAAYGRLA